MVLPLSQIVTNNGGVYAAVTYYRTEIIYNDADEIYIRIDLSKEKIASKTTYVHYIATYSRSFSLENTYVLLVDSGMTCTLKRLDNNTEVKFNMLMLKREVIK